MLKGFSVPLTPRGISSVAPMPPWHYAGDLLVVEYWADPAKAAAYLPAPLSLDDDAGYSTAHFVEWQGVTDGAEELLDPVRCQYREFFIMIAAKYKGERVNYCPYIFVTQDVSFARGWAQGLPKQIGEIYITHTYPVTNIAAPVVGKGGRFGASMSWCGRRMADARVVLEKEQSGRAGLPSRPFMGMRHFPDLANPTKPLVQQLVRGGASNVQVSAGWSGKAELAIPGCEIHELGDLSPTKVGMGHRFSMGLTISTVNVVEDLM